MNQVQAFFLYPLLACGVFLHCTTSPELEQARLDQFAVEPVWTEEELETPEVLAGLPEDAPEAFLLPDLPPVEDQGIQASGTAWAAGYLAASYYQWRKKGRKEFLCSPAFLYNQLNNGRNEGIETIHALKLLKNIGCSHMDFMPYKPEDYTRMPGNQAFQNAANYPIAGFGRIDFTDVDQIRAHLLQGSVIIATLRVTEDFLTLKKAVWGPPRGRPRGRHTMALIGYDHKKELMTLQNSAGPQWGDQGFVQIPYEWFLRLTDKAYVLW